MSPRGTTAGFRRVQTCAELRGLRNVRRCLTDAQASADGNSTHAARCLSLGLMANTFGKRGSRMLLAMSSTLVALGGLDFVEASRLHARQIAHTLVELNQSMAGTYLAASYASPANCHRALSIPSRIRSFSIRSEPSARSGSPADTCQGSAFQRRRRSTGTVAKHWSLSRAFAPHNGASEVAAAAVFRRLSARTAVRVQHPSCGRASPSLCAFKVQQDHALRIFHCMALPVL